MEEVLFDEAIQDFIRPEFLENIPAKEREEVIEKFEKATIKDKGDLLYPKLKDAGVLTRVLKRLTLRVLLAQVNLENGLMEYFAREDMWDQDIDVNEIYKVELGEEIKLKHSYIILKRLETYLVRLAPVELKA